MAPVRDGQSTGTVPKTRTHDNAQQGQHRPRREPFINNTPNNLDQVGQKSVENGHKSGVRRSRKTSNAEIASTQLGATGLPSSDSRLQLSKEYVTRSNQTPVPELTVCLDRSGSSASSSARGESRCNAKAQNMDDREEAASAKNINIAKMPNREEVQTRLEHLQAYIKQTTKLTEVLQDKPDARHRLQYNKLIALVAELKDSENKLRSIISGFDAVDAASEACKQELKEDDQKVRSIQAYTQVLESQRAALEAAASGSVNNQLRQMAAVNESMDAGKVLSQLENIQSRIQNLHDLQDNRSELAHLLGERDQQLSNEFQMVQNKLRDLHLKKALMNKLIEQVENGMPALESNQKESPDTDNADADNDEETDSSNDESLGEAEGQHTYSEASTSQSRDEFMQEINAKLDEAERHFLKFQIHGIVNPLSMGQHIPEEREAAYELYESLNSQAQPHQSALEAQQAQDLLTYMTEAREEASGSRGSSVKRDNNSRVSSFGKNSSKAPKKVNEERISNARLANLQSIISQVTEQYSQGLPLTDELLKSLGNQSDLVMADNENQARVLSLRDSRSQSRDSLASQCIDELQAYVSESDKRVRSSHANSSSSFDDNSACVQHNLAGERSRDLVDISQEDSSSTDEAASSSYGELSYEKKKSNAGARSRPSIEELRDMTNSLQQQSLGMREHAASIANAAKEIQILKSKLPLRDKKTNPQAVSQQMLSELQARKGEFEGLMSKHKGCSSSANQDVSNKPQTLGGFAGTDPVASTSSTSWPNQPAPTSQEGHHSLNESRPFSPISADEQERPPPPPPTHHFTAPLNNSASNLAHTHVHPRGRQPTDLPFPPFGTMYVQQSLHGVQPTPAQQNTNNFWPRANSVRVEHGCGNRGDQGIGPRHEQGTARADPRPSNQCDPSWHRFPVAGGEHDQGAHLPPPNHQNDPLVNQLVEVVRMQQVDIGILKASLTNVMNYLGRLETQLGPGFAAYQGDVHMQRVVTPVLRYHDPGPNDVRGFHQRAFPSDDALNFQEDRKPVTMTDPAWMNPVTQQPMVMHDPMQAQWGYIQEQGATAALNNQVLPGNRTNNYLDNFRSYSRQNLLSNSVQPTATKTRPDEPSSSRTYQNMGVARDEAQSDNGLRFPINVPPHYEFPQPQARQYPNDRAAMDFNSRRNLSRPVFPMSIPEAHIPAPIMSVRSGTPSRGLSSWYTVVGSNVGGTATAIAVASAKPMPKGISLGRPSVITRPSRDTNHREPRDNLQMDVEPISPPLPMRRLSDPRLAQRKVKRNARKKQPPCHPSVSQASTSAFEGYSFGGLVSENPLLAEQLPPTQMEGLTESGDNRFLGGDQAQAYEFRQEPSTLSDGGAEDGGSSVASSTVSETST